MLATLGKFLEWKGKIMRLINNEVFDLEQENTFLNLEEEYNKVAKNDPNFIRILDAMEDRLAEKIVVSKKGKTYISHANASRILIECILSLRHLILRSIQIAKLEKGYKKDVSKEKQKDLTEGQLQGYKKLWARIIGK